jgi:hypothetical protein
MAVQDETHDINICCTTCVEQQTEIGIELFNNFWGCSVHLQEDVKSLGAAVRGYTEQGVLQIGCPRGNHILGRARGNKLTEVREIILLDDVHKAVSARADYLRRGFRKLQVARGRRIALCHDNLLFFFLSWLVSLLMSAVHLWKRRKCEKRGRWKNGEGRKEDEEGLSSIRPSISLTTHSRKALQVLMSGGITASRYNLTKLGIEAQFSDLFLCSRG